MDNASVGAACEISALVATCALIIGALIGYYARGYTIANQSKELIREEDIPQIFPTRDPREWDHFSVSAEQEQKL